MIGLRLILVLRILLSNLSTYVVAPALRDLEPQLTWGSFDLGSDPRYLSSHIIRRGNFGARLKNAAGVSSAYRADQKEVECLNFEPIFTIHRPKPIECPSAVSMLNVGYLALIHDQLGYLGKPAAASHPAQFNLWLLDKPGRRHPDHPPELYNPPVRKYVLPAVFRSGQCLIFVGPGDKLGFPKNGKEGPVDAGSRLWDFWYEVAEVAKHVVARCIAPGWRMGTIVKATQLGTYPFRYRVTVSGLPKRDEEGDPSYMPDPFPDEGWRIQMAEADEYWYTLYNVNGTWSGRGTKGLWRADKGIVRAEAC